MRRVRDFGAALAFWAAFGCSSGGSGGILPDGGAGQGAAAGTGGLGGSAGAGATASGGNAGSAGNGGHTVSGNVQIVNPGSGTATSVILADPSFNPDVPSLVAPSGPKAETVTGSWSIPNVPNGHYLVLVAWENDGLTLDPDASVGGTELVTIEVAGADVNAGSFKVTGALDVISPDGGDIISGSPMFRWQDDSAEDHFELRLYDAVGSLVWQDLSVPGVSGSATVDAQYQGPPLYPATTHQFQVTSVRADGTAISRTENLRGVFVSAP
jgi:hypothetical protein